MGRTKLNETYIFKISIKSNSFDISIGIEILLFIVSFSVEPSRSLLTVCYHELFDLKI